MGQFLKPARILLSTIPALHFETCVIKLDLHHLRILYHLALCRTSKKS